MRINDPVTSLRLNVDELCETHMESADTAYSIDGQAIVERNTGMVPGLIQQLRESSTGVVGGGQGSSATNTRTPIAVGIWNLLHEIGGSASDHYVKASRKQSLGSTEANIRGWAQAVQQFPVEVDRCLAVTDKWIEQIGALLNPVRRWELVGACPSCGERFVVRESEDGKAKSSALTVSKLGAQCGACEALWLPTQFQQLAETLGVA